MNFSWEWGMGNGDWGMEIFGVNCGNVGSFVVNLMLLKCLFVFCFLFLDWVEDIFGLK